MIYMTKGEIYKGGRIEIFSTKKDKTPPNHFKVNIQEDGTLDWGRAEETDWREGITILEEGGCGALAMSLILENIINKPESGQKFWVLDG